MNFHCLPISVCDLKILNIFIWMFLKHFFCDCWCDFKHYKIIMGAKDLQVSYVKLHSLLWGWHSPHREIY